MILAGASVDDVYVIVLFTTFTGMMQGHGVSIISFVNIPVSIILGVVIGLAIGIIMTVFFMPDLPQRQAMPASLCSF